MTQAIIQTNLDELLADCGTIDAVSWQAPRNMSYAQWSEIGSKFQYVSGSLNWWLGDWLNEGEKRYGETYSQAIELTGHRNEYLRDCKWIAGAVKLSARTDKVSWTHHKYVAHLPESEQQLWLEHAEDHGLSSRELKAVLEQANANRKPLPQPDLNWMPEATAQALPLPAIYTNGTNGNHASTIDNEYEQQADELAGDESGYDWTEDNEPQSTIVIEPATTLDSNEWYTPVEYIDAARRVMGFIDLDPASNQEAQQFINAKNYYTKEEDGLAQEWQGNVWLNPPYANPLPWVTKLLASFRDGEIDQAILLVNTANSPEWSRLLWNSEHVVCLLSKRIHFWRPDKPGVENTKQDQMLWYLGDDASKFKAEFSAYGAIR